MGCIHIIAHRVGNAANISCRRRNSGIGISALRNGYSLHVYSMRAGNGLYLNSSRHGHSMSIHCSPVCKIGVSLYLKVTPEILWMVDGEGIFDVKSNTEWKVYNQ